MLVRVVIDDFIIVSFLFLLDQQNLINDHVLSVAKMFEKSQNELTRLLGIVCTPSRTQIKSFSF